MTAGLIAWAEFDSDFTLGPAWVWHCPCGTCGYEYDEDAANALADDHIRACGDRAVVVIRWG